MRKFIIKYSSFILILLILVGLFSPMVQVAAQEDSQFAKEVEQRSCINFTNVDLGGCLVKLSNFIFHDIPAFFLWLSANIFNFFISITLYTTLYFNNFIPEAWAVVRDLSNIFFILILLYIAIKTIVGLGGHDVKKMIGNVIIMALLINFSMFFTKVVIDTSNILALVFYNKINTETSVNGEPRPYASISGEKDVAGGLVSAFDPTRSLNANVFNQAKKVWKDGHVIRTEQEVPTGTMLSLIIISGLVMCFAIYAFFVSGISFIGRLIELWILIIFSPFAFMSFALPTLKGVDYLGWDSWLHRLVKTAFMAPIFMFFLYLIFKLVHSKLFESLVQPNDSESGLIATLLSVLIPAMIILAMLLKATEYAKKGGGEFGAIMVSGAKLAAGLAVGGAALGLAAVGRGTAGAVAKSVQTNATTRKNAFTFKDTRETWNKGGVTNKIKAIGSLNKGVGKAAIAGVAELVHKTTVPFTGKKLGQHMQEQDDAFGKKQTAVSALDAKAAHEFGGKFGYDKDVKYSDLKNEHHKEEVRDEVDKDIISKEIYGKKFDSLTDTAEIDSVKNATKAVDAITGKLSFTINAIKKDPTDPNKLTRTQVTVDGARAKDAGAAFIKQYDTNPAIGEFVQALRKGTYDIRNMPDFKLKSKGILPSGIGTIALVAAGVRLGLKKGGGVEYGKPQKDFLKDIGDTVSEALKNVKINISSGGGGGHSGGDHGGGHDDHGGGGGHH